MCNSVSFHWSVAVPDSAVLAIDDPISGAVDVDRIGVQGWWIRWHRTKILEVRF